MSDNHFKEVTVSEIPRDPTGNVAIDVYVFLPILKKYVIFVAAGNEFSERKQEVLQKHTVPKLFVDGRALGAPKGGATGPTEALPEGATSEVLGEKTTQELRTIFQALMDPTSKDFMSTTQKIESMADDLVAVLAPDVKNLKDRMIQNTKYLGLMNDSAAITTIAVLAAFANGFDSTRSYRDLANACLIMDLSLMEFDDETIKGYYTNRSALPPGVLAKILEHPTKSYGVAAGKIKTINDAALQLILHHHEFHNGKGFPRGIRSETLFPLARILALAVDVFEHLKASELKKTPVTLNQAMLALKEDGVEPHSRRHSKKVIDHMINFLAAGERESVAS